MRRAPAFVLLLVAFVFIVCGGRDWLAGVKQDYPGASAYLTWKNYVLVRYAVDDAEPGLQPAVLLKYQNKEWTELARSTEGFVRGREVMTFIPELDESGVAAFGLH